MSDQRTSHGRPNALGICIIGLGCIGLPTAAAFAAQGLNVHGVDINHRTVDRINADDAPLVEPDLAVALRGAVALGRLQASVEPKPADAFILAVPTPFQPDRTADLNYVRSAAESIASRAVGEPDRVRVDIVARHHRQAVAVAQGAETRPDVAA